MRPAHVDEDDVRLPADAELADLVRQPHRGGAVAGRHLEGMGRLPLVRDAARPDAAGIQSPAHGLDHVGMHVVRRQRDRGAGLPQLGHRRDGAAGRVPLRDVGDPDAGLPDTPDVALVQPDAASSFLPHCRTPLRAISPGHSEYAVPDVVLPAVCPVSQILLIAL